MSHSQDDSLLDAAQRNCSCYKQGHNLHWIAVLKKWTDEPRTPASIVEAPNGVFLVTSEHGLKVAYCHTPGRLASLISQHGSAGWYLVGDTGAMTTPRQANGSCTWTYLSDQPVNDCEKNPCECYDPDEIWDED